MTRPSTQDLLLDRPPGDASHFLPSAAPPRLGADGLVPSASRRVPGSAILALCCMAQFMVVPDISIVNVALPQMKLGLQLSPAGQQWVINAAAVHAHTTTHDATAAALTSGYDRAFGVSAGINLGTSLDPWTGPWLAPVPARLWCRRAAA